MYSSGAEASKNMPDLDYYNAMSDCLKDIERQIEEGDLGRPDLVSLAEFEETLSKFKSALDDNDEMLILLERKSLFNVERKLANEVMKSRKSRLMN